VIVNPRIGQTVRIHYNAKVAPHMPYHGKTGMVEIVSKGKPRNHGIRIDGELVVIPCGNLQKHQPPTAEESSVDRTKA
jgi:ribosomal protein L21E